MDEIEALQKQLAAVQAGTGSTRMSERNCIELISKLQELDLIQLLFTQSGREFLTPDQLERDIEDEILIRAGRANVTDIAAVVQVDLVHVEDALNRVVKRSQGQMRIVHGEIIAQYYLDSIAEELNETLHDSADGVISLSQIAIQFALPMEIILETISSRIGSILLNVKLESGQLYTDAYVQRNRAIARGYIIANTSPFLVSDLANRSQIRFRDMFDELQSLMETGKVRGSCVGRGELVRFIPRIFEVQRDRSIRSFYTTNGYVDYAQLEKLYVGDPHTYLHVLLGKDSFLSLKNGIVAPVMKHNLEAAINEATLNQSWLNASALFPPALGDEDLKEFLSDLLGNRSVQTIGSTAPDVEQPTTKSKGKSKTSKAASRRQKKQHVVSNIEQQEDVPSQSVADEKSPDSLVLLQDKYVLSQELVNSLQKVFEDDAQKCAQQKLEQKLRAGSTAVKSNGSNATTAPPSKAQHKASRKSKSMKFSSTETFESSSKVETPSRSQALEMLLKEPKFVEVFEQDYFGCSPESDELLELVLDQEILPELAGLYERVSEQTFAEVSRRERAMEESEQRRIGLVLSYLELYGRSSEGVKSENSNLVQELLGFLLESLAVSLVKIVVHRALVDCGVHVAAAKTDSSENRDTERPGAEVESCDAFEYALISGSKLANELLEAEENAKLLSAPLKSPIQNLIFAVKNRSAEHCHELVLNAYEELVDLLGIPPRFPLDKKRENALSETVQNGLLNRLLESQGQEHDDPVHFLQISLTWLYSRARNGSVLWFPPRLSPLILENVRASIKNSSTKLSELCQANVELHNNVTTWISELNEESNPSDTLSSISNSKKRILELLQLSS
uniref:E3 UFM1-protein ligase 1-like N-terminal domain-containing protein n=1 Tax=Timspurckia oligopyrenoides TaxID=708627 RepID=A0A7S0ZJI8_9RHOD|mmetsp:Transcript_7766/g.14094  ORF Transcript_7766/g.14094 Transcript_7766/m.14094 type:complete len:849 (+) Transcript_7766:35-2581(+)